MHPCMTWMEVQSFRYMAVLRIGRRGEGVLVKSTLAFHSTVEVSLGMDSPE